MFVIVEMEWDYDNLDYLGVYGPYRSDKIAQKAYEKLMQNKKSYVSYQIKKIEKLKLSA